MTKRYVRKKKFKRVRLGLWVLLTATAVLIAALVLSLSSRKTEDAPAGEDALWDGGWYDDDLNRIQSDRALVRGMKAFEKRTGTKPYLSLLQGIEPEALDLFAQEQFEALFTEGDHLLVVYDEWGESAYYLSGRTGPRSAVSEADVSTLLSCLEEAYADPSNGSYAAAFGAGFKAASRRIAPSKGTAGVTALFVLAGVLLVLCLITVALLRKRALESRMDGEKD